jgi:phosphatidylglycerophosphate synthase
MKKIEDHLENPIDYFIINDICEPLSSYMRENFPETTPNLITLIGLIIGLLSIYCLYKNLYVYAFIFFWIGYILDCLDGYYARKYNMMSVFGDYFDHIRDVVVHTGIILVLLSKLQRKDQIILIILVSSILLPMNMHLACQKNGNSVLSTMSNLCQPNQMDVLKYFGCGTYHLILSVYILSFLVKK